MRVRASTWLILLVAVLCIIIPAAAAKNWKRSATQSRHQKNSSKKKTWRRSRNGKRQGAWKQQKWRGKSQNSKRKPRTSGGKPKPSKKKSGSKKVKPNKNAGTGQNSRVYSKLSKKEVQKRFVLSLGPHASVKVITRQVRNLKFNGRNAGCQVLRFFPKLRMLKVRCGVVNTARHALLLNARLKQLSRVSDSTPDAVLRTAPSDSKEHNNINNGGPNTPMFRKPLVRATAKEGEGLLPYNWGLDRIDEDYSPLDNKPVDFSCYPKQGDGVRVFVIDTGCKIDHDEFVNASISTMPAPGSAFASGIDDHGHGSHIAGVIAGANVGIARNANITCIKAFNKYGNGAATDTISAVEYVIEQKLQNSSIPFIVNLSYSALTGTAISPLDEMVYAASARGIVFVVSAGNAGVNSCLFSPSKAGQAFTVAASTKKDTLEADSNIGPCVELIAPGHQIVSAGIESKSDYEALNGTSMATPHVVGLSALVLSENSWMQKQPGRVRDHLYDMLLTSRSVNVSNFIMPLMETECKRGESATTKRSSLITEAAAMEPASFTPVPVTALPSASPSPSPTPSFSPFPSASPSPSVVPTAPSQPEPIVEKGEGESQEGDDPTSSGSDAFLQYGFGPADDPYAFGVAEGYW